MKDAIRIYKSGVAFLGPLTPEQTYVKVVNEAMRLAEADHGTIYLRNAQGELTRVYASHPVFYKFQLRKDGYTYSVYRTKVSKILTFNQISKVHPEIMKVKIKSDMLVPLTYHGKSIGVLSVASKNKNYTPYDLETVGLFAPFACLAILKAKALSERQEAIETRDLFISMASHEFRTPLTTISGYMELIQKKIKQGQKIPEEWVDLAHSETQRLIKMVKELLEISQIRTGKLQYNFSKCSISEIVGRAFELIKITKPKQEIILKDNVNFKNDQIRADFDKILQVMINLLNNAVKYSSDSVPILLTLERQSSAFKISVADQGIGIAKKEIPLIFQGFYKGSKGSVKKEGMGLGLYVAKRILDKHNGQININSQVRKGTIVEVSLPKAK